MGETVDLDLDAYDSGSPEIGDIVVFHPPAGAENGQECGVQRSFREPCPEPTAERSDTRFIKRIVAGPGDRLAIQNGHPVVNGVEPEEDFIRPCLGGSGCNLPQEITIPPDHYFMLGDNRGASDDSRFWGPVPVSAIVGKVESP